MLQVFIDFKERVVLDDLCFWLLVLDLQRSRVILIQRLTTSSPRESSFTYLGYCAFQIAVHICRNAPREPKRRFYLYVFIFTFSGTVSLVVSNASRFQKSIPTCYYLGRPG